MSKKDLFDHIEDNLISALSSNYIDHNVDLEVKRGRDMGGEWLTIAFINMDGEREAYTIEAERIN